jgi:transcriptional regulator with XRE-family HTH domain
MTPDEIRALRKTLQVTQSELAHLVGAGGGSVTVCRWESGASAPQARFAKALEELRQRPLFGSCKHHEIRLLDGAHSCVRCDRRVTVKAVKA